MNKKREINNTANQKQELKKLNPDKYSWDDLTEFQKQHINAGLDDIKYGRVMSSEAFWEQVKMAESDFSYID